MNVGDLLYIDQTGTTDGAATFQNFMNSITNVGTQSQALNLNAHLINNVLDPVSLQDAATKNYVDQIAQGLNPLPGVYGASTTDIGFTYNNGSAGVGATLTATVNGVFTEDGVSPPVNSRWLYKDDATGGGTYNGIYVVTTSSSGSHAVLTRATDYDTPAQIQPGDFIASSHGTVNTNTAWLQSNTVTTIGTSPISFSLLFSPSSITFSGDNGTPFSTTSLTIFSNNTANICGSTILFNASTPNIQLNVTDANANTIFGSGANNLTVGDHNNTVMGDSAFSNSDGNGGNCVYGANARANGENNVVMGFSALSSGFDNIVIGKQAGAFNNESYGVYIGYESGLNASGGSNSIYIGISSGSSVSMNTGNNIMLNHTGFSGDSNTIRIGSSATSCYISGIASVSVANQNVVTINTVTGQLGSIAVPTPAPSVIVETASSFTLSGNTVFIASNSGLITATLPATCVVGQTIEIDCSSAFGFIVDQLASQSIVFGSQITTPGTGGSIQTNTSGGSSGKQILVLRCIVANTTYQVISSSESFIVT